MGITTNQARMIFFVSQRKYVETNLKFACAYSVNRDVLQEEEELINDALQKAAQLEMYELLFNSITCIYDFLEARGHYLLLERIISITLKTEYVNSDLVRKSKLLLLFARNFESLGKYDDLQAAALDGIKMAGEDIERDAGFLQLLGLASTHFGDLSTAKEYFEKSLELASESKSLRLISTLLSNLGNTALSQNDYASANKYYQDGAELTNQLKDEQKLSLFFVNLGLIASRQGQDEAKDWYDKTLEIAQRIKHRERESLALQNLGVFWGRRGDDEKAHSYYERALNIALQIGYPERISLLKANLGWTTYVKKDYAAAKKLYLEGFRIARKTKHKSNMWGIMMYLGVLYTNLGNYSKAKICSLHSIKLATEIGDNWYLSRSFNEHGELLIKIGDTSGATKAFHNSLYYSTLSTTFKDIKGKALYGLARTTADVNEACEFANQSLALHQEGTEKYSEILGWIQNNCR